MLYAITCIFVGHILQCFLQKDESVSFNVTKQEILTWSVMDCIAKGSSLSRGNLILSEDQCFFVPENNSKRIERRETTTYVDDRKETTARVLLNKVPGKYLSKIPSGPENSPVLPSTTATPHFPKHDDIKMKVPYHRYETDQDDSFVQTVYTVVTETGSEPDSDTDCKVYVKIFGELDAESLYLDKPGDEMQLGSKDTFMFTEYKQIGKITKMQLEVLKYGLTPGWLVVGIKVQREVQFKRHSEVEVYYTRIGRWFQRSDGLFFFNIKPDVFDMPYRLVSSFTSPRHG